MITSFLSLPPHDPQNEWKLEELDFREALFQKFIFVNILDAKWQNFRSAQKVEQQLKKAGFATIKFYYDQAHIMPTVVATKG